MINAYDQDVDEVMETLHEIALRTYVKGDIPDTVKKLVEETFNRIDRLENQKMESVIFRMENLESKVDRILYLLEEERN